MLLLALLACAPDEGGSTGGVAVPCDTGLDQVQASAISAALHPDFGSLVYVRWTQDAAATAWVEYSVDEGEWRSTPAEIIQTGQAEALLLGVPYDHTVTYRVVNDFCAGPLRSEAAAASSAAPPEGLPLPTAVDGDPTRWDPSTAYVFTGMNDAVDGNLYWTFIVDRQGRVVWARRNPRLTVTLHPRVTRAGDALLIDENTFWGTFDGGAGSVVQRMAIDGTVLHTYATPGLRHPFTDGPDNAIVWGAYQIGTETLELVTEAGEKRTLWDCQDFLNSKGMAGSCTSNTVWWDADTDRYLYSFYTLETVFEIDAATGSAMRWFGHLPGSWSFEPAESIFWWQHGGHYTDQGTLLISAHLSEAGEETVVREYTLDEGRQTLTEIWSFGIGEGVHGDEMGEPHRLPNGNTLHNYGTTPRLREAAPGGEVVWDIQWGERFIGRSTPVTDLYLLAR